MNSQEPTPSQLGFRMPAEWEPHDAIWLSWPHDPETFPDRVEKAEAAYVEIIFHIHRSERVELFVLNNDERSRVETLLSRRGVDMHRVRFHVHDYADVWFRDYGPIFLLNKDRPELAMSDWIFNAWGGKYEPLFKDNRMPKLINEDMNLRRFETGIILEGGSIDVNGLGTLMTSRQCLLNKNRNAHLGQSEIERYLSNYLGATHFIWLNDGIDGDDTDGHIDDIARFVDPTTIIAAVEDDPADENYELLKENFEILSASHAQDGKPLRIIPLPMPGRIEDESRRLPASYANFYIGNTVVLVPVFGHANDARALETIQNCLPDRKAVGIYCADLVFGLGTLHCISQQQPTVR